jgi:DNA-binding response OmpR family regulator
MEYPILKNEVRVLIVDDEADILVSLGNVLEEEGYSVFSAANGNQAAAVLSSQMAVSQGIDVLVTDILMAEKDGIELICEVRPKYPTLWIVAMSGGACTFDQDFMLTAAQALGADRILTKPFPVSDLLAAVTAKENG